MRSRPGEPAADLGGGARLSADQVGSFVDALWASPGVAVGVFDPAGTWLAGNEEFAEGLADGVGAASPETVRAVADSGTSITGVEVCEGERVWETAWLPLRRPASGSAAAACWAVACVGLDVTSARIPALPEDFPGARSAVWTGRLLAVAQSLSGAADPSQALDQAFGNVAEALGAKSALVALVERGRLVFRPDLFSRSAFGAHRHAGTAPDDLTTACGAAALAGAALWLPDLAAARERFPAAGVTESTEQAWAYVPIHVDGAVLGVLRLAWPTPQVFTRAQQAFVQAAADHAGHVLHRLALVDTERISRHAAEQARVRSAHLLDLAQKLSAAATPHAVAEVVLASGFAGLDAVAGGVGLLDQDAGVINVLGASGGPSWGTLPLTLELPFIRAARTGRGSQALVEEVRTAHPDAAAWMERAGSRLSLAIPLRDDQRTVGALSVHVARTEITDADAEHLSTVAALTGQALGRALAQERAQQALAELQRALLPRVLPAGRGVRVWAGYRPSPRAGEIGGDFYDTVPLPDGGALLLLGDVQGHDLTASAIMAQLRAVMHALALSGEPPAELLTQADAFLSRVEPDRLATALVVEIRPDSGLAVLASAGHPAPVLVDLTPGADGTPPDAVVLDVPPGLPLGLKDPDRVEHIEDLPACARLVLATDGLVERRVEPITVSLERLAATVSAGRELPGDRLVDRLLAQAPRETGDDAAVMVADLDSAREPPEFIARTMPATIRSAHLARRWASAALRRWGMPEEGLGDALAVLTELVTNGARAATRTVSVILRPHPGGVTVGVSDDSHRMPHAREADAQDVDGRGLTIVEALSRDWWIEEDDADSGKTVWAEVPSALTIPDRPHVSRHVKPDRS